MAVLSGFTYNGVHSEEFGLYYLPTEEDRWFLDPEYEVYSTDIEWKHGGVYYDSKATIRTFTLNCFFENIDVAKRQAIKAWLKRGTIGMLTFDDMPFVYWIVRPGKIPVGNWYYDQDTFSGTVVITFNAYEPFGYLTRKCNTGSVSDNAADYCNLIDEEDMPAAPEIYVPRKYTKTSQTLVLDSPYWFEVYNPGTEACGLSIEIGGSTSNPIRFYNTTNDTFCIFNGLPQIEVKGATSSEYIGINGDTGLVYVSDGDYQYTDFSYHDKGVVRLEPNIGVSNVQYVNGVISEDECAMDIIGYKVTSELKGAVVTFKMEELSDARAIVVDVDSEHNRIYCVPDLYIPSDFKGGTSESQSEQDEFPETGTISIKTVNRIIVQQWINESIRTAIYTSGAWGDPSTLQVDYIKVDYKPRLM